MLVYIGGCRPTDCTGVKYCEIVAEKLKKAGWSLDWVSTVDSRRRTHPDRGGHIAATESVTLCVRPERSTPFMELESAIGTFGY